MKEQISKEETYYLFAKLNDRDKLAREKLIVSNVRLVFYVVHRYFNNTKYDINDLFEIGVIGLIKAIDAYDINKKAEFSTYATKCICNEIYMFFKSNKNEPDAISIDLPIYEEKGREKNKYLSETVSSNIDIEGDYVYNELIYYLRKLVIELDPKEKEIIMMSFGFYDKKYTQKEIAEVFGLCQADISRKIKKIIKKMRDYMEKQGVIEVKHKVKNKYKNN